ncbi:hypothetical protein JCM10213_005110 [Rhodosporidiobolus nylandii]
MPVPCLPLELVVLILDVAFRDLSQSDRLREAQQLSLVCKAWVPLVFAAKWRQAEIRLEDTDVFVHFALHLKENAPVVRRFTIADGSLQPDLDTEAESAEERWQGLLRIKKSFATCLVTALFVLERAETVAVKCDGLSALALILAPPLREAPALHRTLRHLSLDCTTTATHLLETLGALPHLAALDYLELWIDTADDIAPTSLDSFHPSSPLSSLHTLPVSFLPGRLNTYAALMRCVAPTRIREAVIHRDFPLPFLSWVRNPDLVNLTLPAPSPALLWAGVLPLIPSLSPLERFILSLNDDASLATPAPTISTFLSHIPMHLHVTAVANHTFPHDASAVFEPFEYWADHLRRVNHVRLPQSLVRLGVYDGAENAAIKQFLYGRMMMDGEPGRWTNVSE